MDDFFFDEVMKECVVAEEETHCLEILNYSVGRMVHEGSNHRSLHW